MYRTGLDMTDDTPLTVQKFLWNWTGSQAIHLNLVCKRQFSGICHTKSGSTGLWITRQSGVKEALIKMSLRRKTVKRRPGRKKARKSSVAKGCFFAQYSAKGRKILSRTERASCLGQHIQGATDSIASFQKKRSILCFCCLTKSIYRINQSFPKAASIYGMFAVRANSQERK